MKRWLFCDLIVCLPYKIAYLIFIFIQFSLDSLPAVRGTCSLDPFDAKVINALEDLSEDLLFNTPRGILSSNVG
jgi:hypothetical protein